MARRWILSLWHHLLGRQGLEIQVLIRWAAGGGNGVAISRTSLGRRVGASDTELLRQPSLPTNGITKDFAWYESLRKALT